MKFLILYRVSPMKLRRFSHIGNEVERLDGRLKGVENLLLMLREFETSTYMFCIDKKDLDTQIKSIEKIGGKIIRVMDCDINTSVYEKTAPSGKINYNDKKRINPTIEEMNADGIDSYVSNLLKKLDEVSTV